MALTAAQLLDELMGRDRNLVPGEKSTQVHWSHADVCKHFLCGFCANDLFVNTKADLGPCTKIHDEVLKQEYEKSSRYGKMGFEEDFVRYLTTIQQDVERKIRRGHERLSMNKIREQELAENDSDNTKMLTDHINQLLEEIEQLGGEGKVEEAQGVARLVDQLKEEREQSKTGSGLAGQEKQMEVCEVCGAFLIVGDAQARVDDHLQGKQHVGYAKIKSTIEDMKVRPWQKPKEPERPVEEKKEDRERNRDRDRDRDQDRERSHSRRSSGDRNKDRRRRSRSRSRDKQRERRRSRDRSERRDRDRSDRDRGDRDRRRDDRDRDRDRDRERDRRDRDRDHKRSSRRSRSRSPRDRRRERSRDRDEKRSSRHSSRDRDRDRDRRSSKDRTSDGEDRRSKSKESSETRDKIPDEEIVTSDNKLPSDDANKLGNDEPMSCNNTENNTHSADDEYNNVSTQDFTTDQQTNDYLSNQPTQDYTSGNVNDENSNGHTLDSNYSEQCHINNINNIPFEQPCETPNEGEGTPTPTVAKEEFSLPPSEEIENEPFGDDY